MKKYQIKQLEKVCNAVTEARAILEEVLDDTKHDEELELSEDQEYILEGMLDNLTAVEGEFDTYKDEWELYQMIFKSGKKI